MLIAIISDIHDNLPNLDKCLNWCQKNKVKKIIFCGDATTNETLSHFATNFGSDIFIVKGNAEIYTTKEIANYPNINNQGEAGIIEVAGCRLGVCHEPIKIKDIILSAPDFIFYGHTHKPWIETKNKTVIANPGNLAGTFNPATFATLETDTKDLKLHLLADLK